MTDEQLGFDKSVKQTCALSVESSVSNLSQEIFIQDIYLTHDHVEAILLIHQIMAFVFLQVKHLFVKNHGTTIFSDLHYLHCTQ